MDKCKTGLGYNDVPPPFVVPPLITRNFMPPNLILVYPSLDFDFVDVNELLVTEQCKRSPRKTSVDKNRQNTPSPRGNKRNWNQQMSQKLGSNFEMFNKACYVCGSFDHLKNDCNNWYNDGRCAKPVWTSVERVNKHNFSKLTHPSTKRNMVPRTILTRSGPILVNAARPVNTVQSRTAVNNVGIMKNVTNNAYSSTRRPFNKITAANNSKFTKKVNIVKGTRVNTPKVVISVVKGNKGNAVKASETDYLTNYEEIMEDLLPLEEILKEGKLLGKETDIQKGSQNDQTKHGIEKTKLALAFSLLLLLAAFAHWHIWFPKLESELFHPKFHLDIDELKDMEYVQEYLKFLKVAIPLHFGTFDDSRSSIFTLLEEMLERLAGNEYYCFLDGFSGYFQIPIDPLDQEKTTFTCPYGTFAYRRMPFGLCNAPGTFQRCMVAIFHDMIEKTMEVFMDDFSVFGDSFSSCLSHLDKMLQRCEDTNLVLNWEKCHFMVKEGIVLGHKISKSGIEVDKSKVDVIAKLPHPTTVKGSNSSCSRLGLAFEIMCDASDFAVGAVLGQRKTKHFQPIHYASKTMTEAQAHYTTTEKELLAVVYAFEKFRPYLVLSKSIVYTDHSALKYLLAKQDAKHDDRWVLLSKKEFDVRYPLIKEEGSRKNSRRRPPF
ncbi:reverse transcriptase domain-containing protein [Tanacetum coccineum]|uniref:Reverse transcriptase domain-containing protein n=1 Tax=Tanacetum coccineum TaxID=301880 RepID=A0ABQ4YFM2_9ASTR